MLDHGLDLEQLARDAIARGADCLGMAGGDGSQALVASIAVECGVPFVCVTAGTRNHFAQDLGLDREDPRAERPRVSGRGRTADRLRHGQRSVLRQQRVARRLRGDRPAGRLPRREGGNDQGHAAGAVGEHRRALRSAVHDPGRHRGRRRLRHPGLEQPVCDRILLRRRATTPHRHRRARCHRSHRSHREGRRGSPRPGRRRSTKPQPELARVHHRDASRFVRDRVRPLPASTARHSRWRRRWSSGSTPAVFVSWCPKETWTRRGDVAPATSVFASCSMSQRDDHEVPYQREPSCV